MSRLTPPTLKDGHRWDGLRIGLLGGSFNPAHEGHLHIARIALAKLDLDFIWWLITPQNPLKPVTNMAPYDERFASVQKIIGDHARMMATNLEADLGTTFTYDTITNLQKVFPLTKFTFICGMDNALIFHKWDRWKELVDAIQIAFIARPPAGHLIKNCPIRMLNHPNVSWIQTNKMMDISSTQIRNSLKNK